MFLRSLPNCATLHNAKGKKTANNLIKNLNEIWDVSCAYLEPFLLPLCYLFSVKLKLEAAFIANNFGVLFTVFAAVCCCCLFVIFRFFFYFAVDICFTLAPSASIRCWKCVFVCVCAFIRLINEMFDVCFFRIDFVSFTHLFHLCKQRKLLKFCCVFFCFSLQFFNKN